LPTEKRLAGLTYEEAENFITENVNKIFDEMAMMILITEERENEKKEKTIQ
jgi:hypothetical protein